jgi:hypothetical protein
MPACGEQFQQYSFVHAFCTHHSSAHTHRVLTLLPPLGLSTPVVTTAEDGNVCTHSRASVILPSAQVSAEQGDGATAWNRGESLEVCSPLFLCVWLFGTIRAFTPPVVTLSSGLGSHSLRRPLPHAVHNIDGPTESRWANALHLSQFL